MHNLKLMGVFVEQVEMVSRNQWTKIDPHSGCLKCSHAAESCWPETRPFSNFIAPCTFQGTTHTACLRGSLRMCVSSLHYQNINFLKASAGLTHLPGPCILGSFVYTLDSCFQGGMYLCFKATTDY